MTDQDDVLVCAYTSPDRRRNMPESVEITCSECPMVILLSPSGREIQRTRGLKPVCLLCGVKLMKKEGVFQPEPLTLVQKDEILSALRAIRRMRQ